jgi:hypothetical protein
VLPVWATLWYDAVANRADTAVLDQHAVPDALMDEVGPIELLGYDRQITDGDWSRSVNSPCRSPC